MGADHEDPSHTALLWSIAVGTLPAPWGSRWADGIAAALGKGEHPVAQAARELILAAPAETVDAVCDAALADPHGVIAWFCAGHRLTPADPVRRALFLVLTGQAEQYRAADPDGHLLAVGYAAAGADERERLRQAMLDAGELVSAFDLHRMVYVLDRVPVVQLT